MQTQAMAQIDRERAQIATEISWRSHRRPTPTTVARLRELAGRDRELLTQRKVIAAGLRLTRTGWMYYATFHTDEYGPCNWREYAARLTIRTSVPRDVLEAEMQAAGFDLDGPLPVRPTSARAAVQA